MAKYVVAVDGVVGAGKSTVCRMAGNMLGWPAVSTGVFYRTAAFIVHRHGLTRDAESAIKLLLSQELGKVQWHLTSSGEVHYGAETLTTQLQSETMGDSASQLSELLSVRELLLPLQREVVHTCQQQGVIVDGRDIGTIVFPQADLKIFMVANLEQRVLRRAHEDNVDPQALLARIKERDVRDSSRILAPLKKAADAFELDTSTMTAAQAAARMVALIREHLPSEET